MLYIAIYCFLGFFKKGSGYVLSIFWQYRFENYKPIVKFLKIFWIPKNLQIQEW